MEITTIVPFISSVSYHIRLSPWETANILRISVTWLEGSCDVMTTVKRDNNFIEGIHLWRLAQLRLVELLKNHFNCQLIMRKWKEGSFPFSGAKEVDQEVEALEARAAPASTSVIPQTSTTPAVGKIWCLCASWAPGLPCTYPHIHIITNNKSQITFSESLNIIKKCPGINFHWNKWEL